MDRLYDIPDLNNVLNYLEQINIWRDEDPMTINLDRALELYEAKKSSDASKVLKVFTEREDVQILDGKWGAYLKIGKNNYKLPKDTDIATIELPECLKMAEDQDKAPKKQAFRNK
jgi:DNA topoisomerase-1